MYSLVFLPMSPIFLSSNSLSHTEQDCLKIMCILLDKMTMMVVVMITELGNNFGEKNSIFLNDNHVLTNPSCEINSMIWFEALRCSQTFLDEIILIYLNNMFR